jgi:putative membrane protein
MSIMRHVIRFIVAAIVLRLVAFIVPGFAISSFGSALLAALAIMVIGWLVEAVTRDRITPYGRGIVGFLVSVVVLYVIQFIVPGFRIGIFSALIASLIIGIIDIFVPTTRSRVTD